MEDDFDGVQYDTFYAPDPMQLEAEALRREAWDSAVHAEAAYDAHSAGQPHDASACGMPHRRRDSVLVTKPY
jgi:hypothetical protein